jgi:phosphate transport system substrate-binding protein
MRKNLFRKCAAMAACAAMSLMMVTGCNSNTAGNNATDGTTTGSNAASTQQTEQETTKTAEADKKLSGTISLAGSTSMQKLADALAETFMEANSGVTVTVEYSGSSAGIESLLNGSCDIGDASRNLKDSEKSGGAVENIVAIDGIAVIVDRNNTVAGLTKQQLSDIYTGAVTNWSEVGGSDTPIVVVGREAGSGTRGAFEEILKVEDACRYAVECDSTGAAMAKVASTEGAIGYVSLDVLDDSVNALNLDDVAPTSDNIVAGTYFLCRPFVMATKGEISGQNELVQAFFDFLKSDEGKAVVKAVGLITVD